MTRKEEIEHAAYDYLCGDKSYASSLESKGFVKGAKWADEHPKTLYVITRCEEHSDYVEKVFVDKEKAEEYCRKFEDNEDEYGRDITEINVTL